MDEPISIPLITYQKDGLKVDIYTDAIIFHKNGLLMEVPLDIFVEIDRLFKQDLEKSPEQIAEDVASKLNL